MHELQNIVSYLPKNSIAEVFVELIEKYKLCWTVLSDKAWFVSSDLTEAKNAESNDFSNNYLTAPLTTPLRSDQSKCCKLIGTELAEFKVIYEERNGVALGRTPNIWICNWETAYHYLVQGYTETAQDFSNLGAESVKQQVVQSGSKISIAQQALLMAQALVEIENRQQILELEQQKLAMYQQELIQNQEKIVEEVHLNKQTLDDFLAEYHQKEKEAEDYLEEYGTDPRLKATPYVPTASLQDRCNWLIRAYCYINDTNYRNTYNFLYQEFKYRFHVDLKRRHVNSREKTSVITYTFKLGFGEAFFALAVECLIKGNWTNVPRRSQESLTDVG